MPDGTLISAGPNEIAALTLDEPQSTSVQMIWVTVPAERAFTWDGPTARYRAVNGHGPKAICRLRPTLTLYCDKPPQRFVSIPILRLECSQYSTKFLNNYEPPWLTVPGDSGLAEICAKLVALIRSKIDFLLAQVRNPSQALSGVAELRDKLRSLISGLPVLEAHLNVGRNGPVGSQSIANGVQDPGCGRPFELYMALCSMAGHVALLGHDLVPPEFSPYDHCDLLGCFKRVADFIETAVNQGISEQWTPCRFDSVAGGFEMTPSEALAEYKPNTMPWPSLVIGLRIGPEQTRQTVLDWAERCLIATGDVAAKRANRVRGAGRKEWANPPDLTPPAGVLLFAIDKGDETLNLEEKLNLLGDAPLPAEAILFVRQPQAHGRSN
jgi:type VI secretion system protein ImpJ